MKHHPSITRLPLKRGDAYRAVISDGTDESVLVVQVREPLYTDRPAFVVVETRAAAEGSWPLDSGELSTSAEMDASVLPLIAQACQEAARAAAESDARRAPIAEAA